VPEFLAVDKLTRQCANPSKVVRYPGVKEGIYLWQLDAQLQRDGVARAPGGRRKVFVRPEPWTAQYYTGRHNFLDPLLLGMKDRADVVLLPRGNSQAAYYNDSRFAGIEVVDTALDLAAIVPGCDLFIGAGGTMTREMAVLGVPTISVYQSELLDVDRHLLQVGAFRHEPNLTARTALEYMESATRRPPNRELLRKGRVAFDLIKQLIIHGHATSGQDANV
jgi:predicted glycosyltransferase